MVMVSIRSVALFSISSYIAIHVKAQEVHTIALVNKYVVPDNAISTNCVNLMLARVAVDSGRYATKTMTTVTPTSLT